MSFMSNWSSNLKRDLAFAGVAVFIVLGIWSPAWSAPVWQTLLFYVFAIACLVPGIKHAYETGMDSLATALIPAICLGVMMFGAIGHFVWEFFLRY